MMIVRRSKWRWKSVEPRIASTTPLLVRRVVAKKKMAEQAGSAPANQHEHTYADKAAEKNRQHKSRYSHDGEEPDDCTCKAQCEHAESEE
ncbi:hypothetical protein LOC72_26705 [Roseiconus lacunae]|nr:hypothetical protein [Roseiconus lacunae]